MNRLKLPCLAFLTTVALLGPLTASAETLPEALSQEQHAWAKGSYSLPDPLREAYFAQLQQQAHELSEKHPGQAEPLIWEGIITASHAKYQSIFSAGATAKTARDLFLKAIAINPNALDGSALVSLGTLYYKVPRIGSFGDTDKARDYLERGLKLDPRSMDANYFYGEFLYEQGDKQQAAVYLKRALNAAPRPGRKDADEGRRADVQTLLAKIEN